LCCCCCCICRVRVCEQVDHHSIFVFMWALGWPFSALWDLIFRPFTGTILSTSGGNTCAVQHTLLASHGLRPSLGMVVAAVLQFSAL
jgi:hypothetical protein